MSENKMDSFHGKGHPQPHSFVTYSGTRKLVSKLKLRRMGPRPAARLAALVRGWLSTKSRRLQRTRRKQTELESVGTSSRRCSPSMTWMRKTSMSGSTSWSCPTQQEGRGGSCEQTRVSGHKDHQFCSV